MKTFNCPNCGGLIPAKEVPKKLEFSGLKGKFSATVERVCDDCGFVCYSTFSGVIENTLISEAK